MAVAVRGRRQGGKSRLVREFCDESGVPYLFFAAARGASPVESDLPGDPELSGVADDLDAVDLLWSPAELINAWR